MDNTSGSLPAIKVESLPTPHSTDSDANKQPQPVMINTQGVEIPPPPFANSVNEIRSLSNALSAFLRRYDELHDHLNFIKTSIDAKLPNHLLTTANPSQSTIIPLPEISSAHTVSPVPETRVPERYPNGTASNCDRSPKHLKKPEEIGISKNPEETDIPEEPEETDVCEDPEETDIPEDPEETDASKKPEEVEVPKKPEEPDTSKKPAHSELESLCASMCARGVKRYVTTHISDKHKLLQEIPKALKFAENPAKLVLESIGRFFLQGSKAFSKESNLNAGRLASVLILECFLMISYDGIEIAKEEEEYAAKAAVDWRKRIIKEGPLARAYKIDARGLLLLISGFGIPTDFKNRDIRDLISSSALKEISTALRRSIILIPKIPEVIEWMVKNGLEIEAVDLAYTLGLEDKCPPQTILASYFRNKTKDIQRGSSSQTKEAIRTQLSDLKTLRKCLQAHEVNLSKLLPDCKINEKIQQLQDQIIELASEEKTAQKRKPKGPESSRTPKHHDPKRARLSILDNGPYQQEPVHHYNGSTPTGSSYPFITAYSGSSVLHQSGLPEPMTSPVAVNGSGGLAGGSYGASVYRGTISDHMANGRSYAWDEDSDLIEKYLGQGYSRQVQSYDHQGSSIGMVGSYARPPGSSLESFPGLPSSGPSIGGPGSDLYGFADTVAENESYRGGSRALGSGTVRSSYLY